ncbi:MAG: hypothetical protein SFZ24_12720 [Planctomycetota bacterium]|nr:hypothetical protein [Planctomycetota bacterium]
MLDPTDLRRRARGAFTAGEEEDEGVAPPRESGGPRGVRDGAGRSRSRRDAAERVVALAEFLPEDERSAVLAVYRDGVTVRDLALAAAVAGPRRDVESLARQLRRRVRRAAQRALSPRFAFVAAFLHPEEPAERARLGLPCWTPTRRRVARACVLHGLSLRRAAAELGLSFHCVRREMQSILAQAETRS